MGDAANEDKHVLVVIARALAVLTPFFGLTWGLGVGVMVSPFNEGINIAFAFFNSLQVRIFKHQTLRLYDCQPLVYTTVTHASTNFDATLCIFFQGFLYIVVRNTAGQKGMYVCGCMCVCVKLLRRQKCHCYPCATFQVRSEIIIMSQTSKSGTRVSFGHTFFFLFL